MLLEVIKLTVYSPLPACEGIVGCCLGYVIHPHLCPLSLALLVLLEVLGACPPHDHCRKAFVVGADVLSRDLHTQYRLMSYAS